LLVIDDGFPVQFEIQIVTTGTRLPNARKKALASSPSPTMPDRSLEVEEDANAF
jgi:hypothetical protein